MSQIERLPPNALDAERAFLGSLLIDLEAIHRVRPLLQPSDLYNEAHAHIYQAILDLHDAATPVDYVLLCGHLEQKGLLESVGGAAYICGLLNATPTAVHALHYARQIEKAALRNRLIGAAGKIAGWAYDEGVPTDELPGRCLSLLLGTTPLHDSRGQTLSAHVLNYWDRVEALSKNGGGLGLPTGFPALDGILKGLEGYVILAGRPSHGKSALVLDIARYLVRWKGRRVAYFSLEDSATMVVNRLVAKATGMNVAALRDGRVSDWGAFMNALNEWEQIDGLWLDDSPELTVDEIRARAMQQSAVGGVDLVVVDYVQLVSVADPVRDRREYTRVGDVSKGLKALARLLGVPVLAVSQLSRACEQRNDKRPMLSDLRETGALEQDADAVLFVYRDEMYHADSAQAGYAEVCVAKNKNGPVGRVNLRFMAECVRFQEHNTTT